MQQTARYVVAVLSLNFRLLCYTLFYIYIMNVIKSTQCDVTDMARLMRSVVKDHERLTRSASTSNNPKSVRRHQVGIQLFIGQYIIYIYKNPDCTVKNARSFFVLLVMCVLYLHYVLPSGMRTKIFRMKQQFIQLPNIYLSLLTNK